MRFLGIIGRVFTPLAMVIFFSHEIYISMGELPAAWQAWALTGAVATGIGVEVVGILSGHTFERFWVLGDRARMTLAAVLLAVYAVASLVILRGNPALLPVPIIASVVYLVSALAESAGDMDTQKRQADAFARRTAEQRQAAEDAHRRKLELARLEQQTQLEMARIQRPEGSGNLPATSRSRPAESNGDIPTDWRKLTDRQKYTLAHATREDREHMFPDVSGRTRRAWHNRLDKLAAKNGVKG